MSETTIAPPIDPANITTIEIPVVHADAINFEEHNRAKLARLVENHRQQVANNNNHEPTLPPPDNSYVGAPISANNEPSVPDPSNQGEAILARSEPEIPHEEPLAPQTVSRRAVPTSPSLGSTADNTYVDAPVNNTELLPVQTSESSNDTTLVDSDSVSSPEEPPIPTPTYVPGSDLNKELSGVQVDVSSGVTSESRDYADEHLRQETVEPGVKGFLKKVWHGNIARDYIRQKSIVRGEHKIIDEKNLYVLSSGTEAEHDDAMSAVIERFVDEGNTHLHKGETIQEVDSEYAGQLRNLITAFARGETSYDALVEGKTRLVDQFGRKQHEEDRNKGKMYADNLIEVAINARAAFDHGVGLDAIDSALSFNVGEAQMGARTESSHEITDRLIDKVYNIPGLSLVNETTVGLGVAVGMAAAKFTTRKFVTAASRTVGLGVGTGIIGGVRESHRVGQERRLHSRQMAEGGQIDENDSARRLRMEATRYNTIEASDLINQLHSARGEDSAADSLARLLSVVTEADTRISLSDDSKIDLIAYEGKVSIERQRADLDRALAESKVALQELLNDSDDATLVRLGVQGRSLDDVISTHSGYVRDLIEGDISQKDKEFSHLRRNRVLAAAAIGATVGIVLGESSQEIHALFDHSMQGVFDHPELSQDRQTELAALFHNHPTPSAVHPNVNFDHSSFKLGNDALDLPTGYHVVHNSATGALELMGADNKVVVGSIGFDPSGHLNVATAHLLQEKGFGLHTTSEAFQASHTATETISSTPESYIQTHPSEFTSVHRELWYDNDTPYPDKNELATWWGGTDGTGINSEGNYVLNISHMMPGGSYEGNQSANYLQLLHEGKLELAVSLNSNTQDHVIMIPFDSHGDAIINAKDPALQSVFVNQAGHAHFIGGFAEVVQNTGKDAQGDTGIKMLGTLVGDNHPRAISETVNHLVQQHGEHIVTHIEAPAGAPLPVEIAPVIPVYARRGMEDIRTGAQLRNPNVAPFYYGGKSLEELRDWIAADLSRLHPRHQITNPDGTKIWVEADNTPVERDVQRERDSLTKYLDRQKEINGTHYQMIERMVGAMAPMDDKCRVSANVPAWMEAANLKHFLEEYTHQVDTSGTELDSSLYEVNVLINRKSGTAPDNSIDVINSFVQDFQSSHGFKPQVNYYDIELDPPFNNVGYARKLLTDAVIMRSTQRPNQSSPLYIETEDADMVHIDPRTVINLIEKLDQNPHLDAVRGVQDRSPEYLIRNDMLFIRRRSADFFEMLASKKQYRDPVAPDWNFTWNRIVTGGWNTGYTAEAYAMIDGYEVVETGEDMSVGEKITMIRGDGSVPNLEVVGKVYTRADSSPRRFIHEILTDQGAYAGDNFSNEEVNQLIRDNSIDSALESINKYSRINGSNIGAFNDFLQWQLGNAASVTPSKAERDQLMKRLVFWLGFKQDDYDIVGDEVVIRSLDNVKLSLENYRHRYESRLAVSS